MRFQGVLFIGNVSGRSINGVSVCGVNINGVKCLGCERLVV